MGFRVYTWIPRDRQEWDERLFNGLGRRAKVQHSVVRALPHHYSGNRITATFLLPPLLSSFCPSSNLACFLPLDPKPLIVRNALLGVQEP